MHNIHIAAKALLLSVVAAAVGILIAAMLTFAANNASIALAQAERRIRRSRLLFQQP